MARILDGRRIAKALSLGLRDRVGALSRPPGLAVIQVGEVAASSVYVNKKEARARHLGFHQQTLRLSADISQDELLQTVRSLNEDPAIDGILIQLPLPKHIDASRVLDHIDPAKDVDGFHSDNMGRLAQGRPRFVPCTPLGVMRMLAYAELPLSGLHAVVVGRSNIVGRPQAMLLEQANCTVTVCHSRTRDLAHHLASADLVVAAVGRPRFIRGEWLKDGVIVIDVGINRLPDGSLCGDVDFDSALPRASAITPVPGGVGPMTIATLMSNTLVAAEARAAVG
jgi:methylenetetrahydrofolate dehydrogenase (NADP+) / methenyltetrahydrofolate cyclohydrolase